MKNIFILFTFSFLNSVSIFSQVKIGDNHETLNSNALLELESTNKGVLLPRVSLSATNLASPMSAHVVGMVVYNTATSGSGLTAVSPGIYYNTGTSWEKMVIVSNVVPAGMIDAFSGTSIPAGYLYCNGQAVSRTTYATLFASIGTTYGAGDGSTTFNLPDYRGYFLRGQNDGSGNDPDAASRTNSGNGTIGDNVGTKQAGQIQSHNHTYGISYNAGVDAYGYEGGDYLNNNSLSTNYTGGNETRPKNINVKYCIKY